MSDDRFVSLADVDWEPARRRGRRHTDNGDRFNEDPPSTAEPRVPRLWPLAPKKLPEPDAIPPRPWLYGRIVVRGVVSATVAPGGSGKTSLLLAEALAMVTSKPLLGISPFQGKPLRVFYWNGEDPEIELDRKLAALRIHYGITDEDIGDRLIVRSGFDLPFKVVSASGNGTTLNRDVIDDWAATIRHHAIDVNIFDPFISTHGVNENENVAIDMTVKTMSEVSERTGSATCLGHHTRKTSAEELTVDDSRGAKALIDAARIARVINPMSVKDAGVCRVEKRDRLDFFKILDANGKANLSSRSDEQHWFRFISICLGNETEERPADHVGVVTAWDAPALLDGLTVSDLLRIQWAIDAGTKENNPWRCDSRADRWAGECIAEVLDLDLDDEHERGRVNRMLSHWQSSGAVKKAQLHIPQLRKSKDCIVVGEWATDPE